ncbi:MAG: RluA family pseudouridine synthase [Eubacteriales bacterium]|nr:RluA family pseudouridine synthase [Eubacteriales bacterium]
MSRTERADWTALYEDEDIWVVSKAAGLAVQSRNHMQKDLESELQKVRGGAPCFLIHRLDQPVEGLMVVAKNKQAATELGRQLVGHELAKDYIAIATGGSWQERKGCLVHRLEKQAGMNRSEVVEAPRGKEAMLTYRVLDQTEANPAETGAEAVAEQTAVKKTVVEGTAATSNSLLYISLQSGRHHQIRVQLSAVGHPLLGDVKYGAEKLPSVKGPALCACHLKFRHPRTKQEMEFGWLPRQSAFRDYRRIIEQWMFEEWRLTDV